MDYDRVYQLKKDFPQLTIAINGGIKTIEEMKHHLQFVDGVMVGREAYQNPSLLGYVDQMLFNANADIVTPRQAVEAMFPYIEKTAEPRCLFKSYRSTYARSIPKLQRSKTMATLFK